MEEVINTNIVEEVVVTSITEDTVITAVSEDSVITTITEDVVNTDVAEDIVTTNTVELVQGNRGHDGMNYYIQDTEPDTNQSKYFWVQTNYGELDGYTIWIVEEEV